MEKIFIIALMGLSFTAQAQTSLKINLQQTIKIGLKNRYDLKAKQYNIGLTQNQLSKSKKAWIPQISAEGNLQYNSNVRPTYVPGGFAGFTEPQMLAFGAKNQTTFGLSLNQTIFKPGINTNIKIDKAKLALQKEKMRGNKIDIKNDIATAYFNVLLKQLQFKIATNEESRNKKYADLAKGKYQNGALIKNDYLRAKLDYKNAQVKTNNMKQNYQLALDYLKYQINIPTKTKIVLTDSIGAISFGKMAEDQGDFMSNRTEIKQLKLSQNENALQLKDVRQNALPTISLVGYYAQLYQNQQFHYEESEWWAPQSYVGLKISIPITANFANKNNIRQHKIRKQQLAMNLKQTQSTISYQIQKARTDVQNALENMQSTKQNYALSQSIYKNQQQQFAIGVFKYSNLLDTEKSLNQAEQNYIKAVYQYMVAQLEYEKAIGNL